MREEAELSSPPPVPASGYEHLKWEAVVQEMEPDRLFSFIWPQPKSLDKSDVPLDYSGGEHAGRIQAGEDLQWHRQPCSPRQSRIEKAENSDLQD
jgi:hypothetical protein